MVLFAIAAILCGCDKVNCMEKQTSRTCSSAVENNLASAKKDVFTVEVSPNGAIRTPEAARDAVRAEKSRRAAAGDKGLPIEVVFADGTYHLEKPILLGSEDSGTPEAPIVWKARNRGKAIFTAATVLDWRKPGPGDADALKRVPEAVRKHVRVATVPGSGKLPTFLNSNQVYTPSNDVAICLFAGGDRLQIARWPNDRLARFVSVPIIGTFETDSSNCAAWSQEHEPWVFACWEHDWIEGKTVITGIDAERHLITVPEEHVFSRGRRMVPGNPYYVFNCLCELDRPGEWVVDRAQRRLYAWPKPDAPLPELVLVDGLVRATGLSDVTFDGFVFEKCRKEAFQADGSTRVTVQASIFRSTGSLGVRMRGGSDCRVEGCDLYDLGEGGIELEGGDREALVPGNHVAANNNLHDLGKFLFNYRPGVRLIGCGNRAEHNLIHNLRHAAILFDGNDHYIGWNVIHDVCTENFDAGAIYTWQNSWLRRGGVIEHNLIHRCGKLPHPTGTEGVYLDDHSSDVDVRCNIIDFMSRGLFNGGGQSNRYYGNVILNCGMAYNVDARGVNDRFATAISNKLASAEGPKWRKHYPLIGKYLDYEPYAGRAKGVGLVVTNNVFAACGAPRHLSGEYEWGFISKTVTVSDNVTLAGDPGFRDYRGFDWRAASDSPVKTIIDACCFEKMGLFDSPRRISPAVKFGPELSPAFKFGEISEGSSAELLLDFDFAGKLGKLPAGRQAPAYDYVYCRRLWSDTRAQATFDVDQSADARWQRFNCAFTPVADAKVALSFSGSSGQKTRYRAITISGAATVHKTSPGEFLANEKEPVKAFELTVTKDVPVFVTFEALRTM